MIYVKGRSAQWADQSSEVGGFYGRPEYTRYFPGGFHDSFMGDCDLAYLYPYIGIHKEKDAYPCAGHGRSGWGKGYA